MQDHAQRLALHNEVHARPPEPVSSPTVISHVVMVIDRESRQASRLHLSRLLQDHHLPTPEENSTHLRADFGSWRLRWELHTEFVTWTFMRVGNTDLPGGEPESALRAVPQAWLSALPGKCLSRIHVWAMPAGESSAAWYPAVYTRKPWWRPKWQTAKPACTQTFSCIQMVSLGFCCLLATCPQGNWGV